MYRVTVLQVFLAIGCVVSVTTQPLATNVVGDHQAVTDTNTIMTVFQGACRASCTTMTTQKTYRFTEVGAETDATDT
jgi:hypothetical protein